MKWFQHYRTSLIQTLRGSKSCSNSAFRNHLRALTGSVLWSTGPCNPQKPCECPHNGNTTDSFLLTAVTRFFFMRYVFIYLFISFRRPDCDRLPGHQDLKDSMSSVFSFFISYIILACLLVRWHQEVRAVGLPFEVFHDERLHGSVQTRGSGQNPDVLWNVSTGNSKKKDSYLSSTNSNIQFQSTRMLGNLQHSDKTHRWQKSGRYLLVYVFKTLRRGGATTVAQMFSYLR